MKFGIIATLALCPMLPAQAWSAKAGAPQPARAWAADNGNGTFTNPIFEQELEDPDLIRVGDDFYMTGTTMHLMPGLPILHSRDLVNWTLLGYAFDRLDMGPEYRMEGGREVYGQGIWAPAIRYHNGTFYIFTNINGYGLQIYSATNPAGPWTHKALGGTIYDLGILFDDDGRIYAVHGYDEVHLIELKPDLSGYVEGSDRVIIAKGNGMGEGHHFYKIHGKYYIISANYAPVGRMQAARADKVDGPYETVTISARETMGAQRGRWATGASGPLPKAAADITLTSFGANEFGAVPLHQGGIVDLPNGDWWGWSMMDMKSAGRMTFLSPVTWQDGWPYFGLPGNLGRSPRTWLKPATGVNQAPAPTWDRDDDFAGAALKPIWQWNHLPVDAQWSLTERRGMLRLHTLPAPDFLRARNSLTQAVAAPASSATVTLDGKGLRSGDVAGLGMLGIPYYWIGLARTPAGLVVRMTDGLANKSIDLPFAGSKIVLRAAGDFEADSAELSYSTDGKAFTPVGGTLKLAYQLKTFQGYRFTLFAFNAAGAQNGGYADFDDFTVVEPFADRAHYIPIGKTISFANLADDRLAWANPLGMLHFAKTGSKEAQGAGVRFRIHDRGQGKVALEAVDGSGFLTVVGIGLSGDVRLVRRETPDSLFQWQDMLDHEFMLMSLKTHRYVGLDPRTGEPYSADSPGAQPDRKDGTVFRWSEAASAP